MMVRVIQNAFKHCGIHPFDDNLFTDADFGPSPAMSTDCSHVPSSYPELVPTSSESTEMTDSQASSGSPADLERGMGAYTTSSKPDEHPSGDEGGDGGDGERNEDSVRGNNDKEDQDRDVVDNSDGDDEDRDNEDGDGDNEDGDGNDEDGDGDDEDRDGDGDGDGNGDRDDEDGDNNNNNEFDGDTEEAEMVGQQGDMGVPDEASDDNDSDYMPIVKDEPVSDV